MPERRVSGRQRRSIGFPMLTLLLLTAFLAVVAWVAIEFMMTRRLPF